MRAKEKIAAIVAVIAIIIGLTAIIKLVSAISIELTVGLISLSFGLTAAMWTLRARKRLSPGSSLRKYTTNFFICLIFLLIFSIWTTTGKIVDLRARFGIGVAYFEYIFMTAAYLTFVVAAYQIMYMGREFGFEEEAKAIKKAITEKKNVNKKRKKR